MGLEGGEGVLPGVAHLRRAGSPRAPLKEEARAAGRAVHEKPGRSIGRNQRLDLSFSRDVVHMEEDEETKNAF